MSERKGPPSSSSDDRRKFNESSWRYGSRYGSSNNNQTSNNNNSNEHYSSSLPNRRYPDQRSSSGLYLKMRNSSTGNYNSSSYNRYPYESKYGYGGYNANKRYGPYRSNSSSSVNNQEHFYHSKPSTTTTTTTTAAAAAAAVPTTQTQQQQQPPPSSLPPFNRYRSLPDSNEFNNKRSGDLISNRNLPYSYDNNRESYRSNRFYGYNRDNGYDNNRYRGYQRKVSNEHNKYKEKEDDDLIYGSIKPKLHLKSEDEEPPVPEPKKESDEQELIKDSTAESTVDESTKMDIDQPEKEEEKQAPEELPEQSSNHELEPKQEPEPKQEQISKEEEIEPAKKEIKPSSLIASIRDDIDELDVDDELEKLVLNENLKENYLPKIEGDIFPMNRLESKLWDLKQNSKLKIRSQLPYLMDKPVNDFNKYPFFKTNILIHEQAIRPKLLTKFSIIKKFVNVKGKKLTLEFYEKQSQWQNRVKIMEDQLLILHPHLRDSQSSSDEITTATATTANNTSEIVQDSITSTSSRRNRNTGIVNSEAEFAEILQRMKEEEENDPLFRARQAAATIPEQIIDEIEKNAYKFISTNNLVTDLVSWESRLHTDKIDNWSKLEHEQFCDAYASYPKRFGKISTVMENRRSAEECVLHYYRTKRETNYKQLVAAKNKRRKGRKTKSRTQTTVSTPVATEQSTDGYFATNSDSQLPTSDLKNDEIESSKDNVETEEEKEVLYTETGRRKRAAAPNFDSLLQEDKKKKPVNGVINLENVNKKLEDVATTVAEEPKVKKPRISKKKIKEQEDLKQDTEDEDKSGTEGVAAHQLELLKSYATAALPAEQQQQQQQQPPVTDQLSLPPQFQPQQQEEISSPPPPTQVKVSKKDKKPPHITSYWSINDANKFPGILAEFGTQWQLIAKKIQTKTTTMVRNYYSKNANNVNNWVAIAREADLRRNGTGHSDLYEQQPSSFQQQQQSMKLPSLKDITHGMPDVYNRPLQYQSPSPPTFNNNQQQQQPIIATAAKREDEERKYVNVLNPVPQQAAPAAPSRTSIMSLLNSDPPFASSQPQPATTHANPLNNILNPYPQQQQQQQQPPPQQQPSRGGLFSLAALAEVAAEGYNNSGFKNLEESKMK